MIEQDCAPAGAVDAQTREEERSVPLRVVLPSLTPAQARRERAFAWRWKERTFLNQGTSWSLEPLPPIFAAEMASSWRSIRTAAGPELLAPTGALRLLLERRFPEVDPEGLAPDVEALLVEASLQPVLAELEPVLATSLAVTILGRIANPRGIEAAVAVGAGEPGRIPLLLRLDAAGRRRFDTWAFRFDRRRERSKDAVATVSFRLGTCNLAIDRLVALRPGDGIVIEHANSTRSGCVVVVGERLVQRAEAVAQGYRLSGHLLPIEQSILNPFSNEPAMSQAQLPEDDHLRDVQVRVVFELGRIEVPIGEIETLTEGYVFETGRRTDEAVDIVIGGKIVGKGDLVLVGETLAVRVLRLDR
jgi:type III secretion protein Q